MGVSIYGNNGLRKSLPEVLYPAYCVSQLLDLQVCQRRGSPARRIVDRNEQQATAFCTCESARLAPAGPQMMWLGQGLGPIRAPPVVISNVKCATTWATFESWGRSTSLSGRLLHRCSPSRRDYESSESTSSKNEAPVEASTSRTYDTTPSTPLEPRMPTYFPLLPQLSLAVASSA
jgi:hypothetical protein